MSLCNSNRNSHWSMSIAHIISNCSHENYWSQEVNSKIKSKFWSNMVYFYHRRSLLDLFISLPFARTTATHRDWGRSHRRERREPHRKTIERKRRKDVHSVASDFVSDIPCGAPDVSDTWAAFDGEDELIRRGRKGREKRKARRMAITGVGRSWWGKRSIWWV